MIRTVALAAALAFVAVPAVTQARSFTTYPPDPFAGEEFVAMMIGINGASPTTVEGVALERAPDGNLFLTTRINFTGFSVPSSFRAATVGRLSLPGYYIVTEKRHDTGSGAVQQTQVGAITVGPSPGTHAPQFAGLTGNWYAPDEAGTGLNILQNEQGQLFAIWLTFQPVTDTASPPARVPNLALVMPSGRWISPTEFRGLLYATRGTPVQVPFVAVDSRVVPVGYASLNFTSETEAVFSARGGLELGEVTVGTHPDFFVHKTIRKFLF